MSGRLRTLLARWRHPDPLRATALRVACLATAAVGVVYLLVAAGIYLSVSSSLTGRLETRVTADLENLESGASPWALPGSFFGRDPYGTPSGRNHFGPPTLVWLVSPDGVIFGNDPTVVLPPAALSVVTPTTVSVENTDLLIDGAPLDGGWRGVVGVTEDQVNSSLESLLISEAEGLPAVLLLIFLGSLVVGTLVARPIERSRRQQLAFSSNASHELRTPLSVIEAETALALSKPRKSADYKRVLERVARESARMKHLVDELLWLARYDEERSMPATEPVDISSLARGAADRFAAVAAAHGDRFDVDADDTAIVVGPPSWLDRLVTVLLDNAFTYTPDGGSVQISASRQGARVVLSVDDSGPGIPADERSRVFDRFHRAADGTAGTGLGLAIADSIVQSTQGRWDLGVSDRGGLHIAVSWPAAL